MSKKIDAVRHSLIIANLVFATTAFAQNVGIVRENFFSTDFDSTINMPVQVLDSSTIRLGSVNPSTGAISNLSSGRYQAAINLNGATINPYLNHYYIGSGFNLLTFDISTGAMVNNVPIAGPLPSGSFQNYRFNPADSVVYGMVPQNFYSTYFDSTIMSPITVLDSARIRFASIDPSTGQYSLIGPTGFKNLYTLAGNSIDPYQMLYYYSEVDTLVGIDVYTGNKYSEVPIQLPATAIFENITYSCADTSIYGMVRQNFMSRIYDPQVMDSVDVVDSTTFRLAKINPNNGAVTFISPVNLGAGGNLTGGSFIDPNTMTYYFSNGNQLVGVSMISGLVTSNVLKTYQTTAVAFDMMRSTLNCLGASRIRSNRVTGLKEKLAATVKAQISPNPVQSLLQVKIDIAPYSIEIADLTGKVLIASNEKTIDVSGLSKGLYFVTVKANNGESFKTKIIKD